MNKNQISGLSILAFVAFIISLVFNLNTLTGWSMGVATIMALEVINLPKSTKRSKSK